ncbi:MAG: lipid A export permease/ATP-binding protein MsbA [Gammaproteobacteria bacterium]|nr:lipid A export permease/ATP-binding protein MsbA [Gammaproteobacteria bacterium]
MARPDPVRELDAQVLAIYKRLLGYALPHWGMFSAAIVAMVVYAATDTGFAALMRPLLDGSFVEKDQDIIRLVPMALLGLALARGGAGFVSSFCMAWVGRQVIKTMRKQVFSHFLTLPTAYYDHSSAGALLSKLTFNIEQVSESTTKAVTVVIRDTLTIIGLVAWMFYLNALLSVFIFIMAPVIGGLLRFVSKRFRRYSTRIQDSMGDVTQVAEEMISGHRVIKIFGGQEYERRNFEAANENNRKRFMKLVAVKEGSNALVQFIAAFGMAGIVYVATGDRMLEDLSVGTFMSFLGAMLLLMAPLKRLTDVNVALQRGIAAGQSIFEVLDSAPEPSGGSVRLERAVGDIEFAGVGFSYTGSDRPVLRDISFRVPAGSTMAFVGRSGSGKSTLVSLLPRFYDPVAGVIRIDSTNIGDYRLEDLRSNIALVSQDVTLFNDTIARNIAYGALEDADREAVEAAARAAHVLQFTDGFTHGLDTVVGDRGVLLSGGQRQRIAIARALLKDAPILILDEATSALDTESERHIKVAMETLMKDRTTLVIAHRLSTVEGADTIVVLHEGRIVESGNHADLLARNGHYAALYRMQFDEA